MVAMRVRISRSALSCHGGIGIRAGFRLQCHRHVGSTPTDSIFGDLAERPIAAVLKTADHILSQGSNPESPFYDDKQKADKKSAFCVLKGFLIDFLIITNPNMLINRIQISNARSAVFSNISGLSGLQRITTVSPILFPIGINIERRDV